LKSLDSRLREQVGTGKAQIGGSVRYQNEGSRGGQRCSHFVLATYGFKSPVRKNLNTLGGTASASVWTQRERNVRGSRRRPRPLLPLEDVRRDGRQRPVTSPISVVDLDRC
jgi:hypothetical protein